MDGFIKCSPEIVGLFALKETYGAMKEGCILAEKYDKAEQYAKLEQRANIAAWLAATLEYKLDIAHVKYCYNVAREEIAEKAKSQ